MSVLTTSAAEPCPALTFLAEGDHRTLIATARAVLRDHERAEEVCQDVLLRFWARPEAYDPRRGTVVAYLTVVCRSRARDVVRADLARQRREQRSHGLSPGVAPADPAEALGDEKLLAALAGLPAGEAEAIELAFMDGLTYTEVASRLGIPEGTAKSRIRRGLAHLAVALAHHRVPTA